MDAFVNNVYVPTSDDDESNSKAFMYTQNVLQGNNYTSKSTIVF